MIRKVKRVEKTPEGGIKEVEVPVEMEPPEAERQYNKLQSQRLNPVDAFEASSRVKKSESIESVDHAKTKND